MKTWFILAAIVVIGVGAGSYFYYTKVVVVPVTVERPPGDQIDFKNRFQPKPPPPDGGRSGSR